MLSTVDKWKGPEIDSDGRLWLDNPLEGDGVVHDKCGTPDCCEQCEEDNV